uniref:Putative B-box zinc finger protein 32-like n=1 Tax=Davidia involucrata TaxID=16924 RepID=A0A5B7AGE1_DAVIN
MKARVCELCNGEAALYCPSDSAFLCWKCDSKVHAANFLVARHVRRTVCSKCKGVTNNRISGVGFQPVRPVCRSCLPETSGDDLDSLSSTSFSACISSTESCGTPTKRIDFDRLITHRIVSSGSVTELSGEKLPGRFTGEVTSRNTKNRETKTRSPAASKVDSKAEGVLVNWCRKLGLTGSDAVPVASKALGVCCNELTVLPFRVFLAASLWFSLRLCGDRSASTWQILKRLEEISGVPAKLILGAESKLARVLKMRKPQPQPRSDQQDQEEGWAECSA